MRLRRGFALEQMFVDRSKGSSFLQRPRRVFFAALTNQDSIRQDATGSCRGQNEGMVSLWAARRPPASLIWYMTELVMQGVDRSTDKA